MKKIINNKLKVLMMIFTALKQTITRTLNQILTKTLILTLIMNSQNVIEGAWCSKYSRKQNCRTKDCPLENSVLNCRAVYDVDYFDVERDLDQMPDVIEVRYPDNNQQILPESLAVTEHVEPVDYRLKIGDVLQIGIYGEEGTIKNVAIDPRGRLTYLFVDPILASGKTIPEIRQELTTQISKYYRDVTLQISPVQFNAEYFIVAGEVNNPGRKPFVGRPTLLSAVCQGDGLTTIDFRNRLIDMADLDRAFLARRGEYIPIDFIRLVRGGDLSLDVRLQPNDYIYLPSREVKQIYVLGEVAGPTSIDYWDSISLVEVLAEAGDVTERASNRAVILRGTLHCPVRYLVDYMRIVKGCCPDFPLCPGDIVYVPPRKFTTIREIFRNALYDFVDITAGVAGYRAYIGIHPHAADNDNFGIIIGGSSGGPVGAATTAGNQAAVGEVVE